MKLTNLKDRNRAGLYLLSLLLCLAGLLFGPARVSAQKLLLPDTTKDTSAPSPEKVTLPATDEEIDKTISEIEFRLTDLRQLSRAATETLGTKDAGLLIATPEELRKRQKLLSELVGTLDKNAEILR